MKDVQQIGGPFEEQSVFIGLARQLTVDTTNYRVLIHDGETPGGHMLIGRDESDARYQATNAELTGFAEIDPLIFGFVARTAPGVYISRTLSFSGAFETSNLNGRVGNPAIALLDEQTQDFSYTGNITFSGSVTSTVAWNGPTEGTHTGPVVGNITGDLTGNVEGNTEGNHLGGIDVRGAEVFFDVNQIPQEAIAGLLAALAAIPGALPTGVILMWSGGTGDIPAGYFLCDGTNGTPDLRDRFMLGAGGTADPHEVGGTLAYTPAGAIDAAGDHTHNITVGDHALTIAEIPAHTHTTQTGLSEGDTSTNFTNGNNNIGAPVATSSVGGGAVHSHPGASDAAGNHTHGFTGTATEIIPPYYALCFIMKG